MIDSIQVVYLSLTSAVLGGLVERAGRVLAQSIENDMKSDKPNSLSEDSPLAILAILLYTFLSTLFSVSIIWLIYDQYLDVTFQMKNIPFLEMMIPFVTAAFLSSRWTKIKSKLEVWQSKRNDRRTEELNRKEREIIDEIQDILISQAEENEGMLSKDEIKSITSKYRRKRVLNAVRDMEREGIAKKENNVYVFPELIKIE